MEARADLHKARNKVLLSMLEQYEEEVREGVEAEVKDMALAAVEEEGRILRYKARQRLQAVEAEVQQMIKDFLACAQEQLFQKINTEMEATLEDLDTRMRGVLGREPPPARLREPPAPAAEASTAMETPEEAIEDNEEPERPSGEPPICQQEIRLNIKPPIPPEALLHFYRSLWQMPELNIIRAEGSADKGMVVDLRLAEPADLLKSLSELQSVSEARDASGPGDNDRYTISVGLKAPKIVRSDAPAKP